MHLVNIALRFNSGSNHTVTFHKFHRNFTALTVTSIKMTSRLKMLDISDWGHGGEQFIVLVPNYTLSEHRPVE